ncbi:hypothetical protein [Enterococcus columbae]|nr:hypothetical protein [Enterococcus columbae]
MSFLPVIMGIQTIKEYHFINYPLLIAVLIIYLVYIIFSIRHHHRNIYKKYFSSCYLVLTLFILFFSGSIAIIFLIYQKNPIVAILDLILTVGFIINSQIRMFQGIKSSVQKHEKFNSRAYLLSEKIGCILLVVGGSGITALSAIINIRTNGASNGGAIGTAIPVPILGTILGAAAGAVVGFAVGGVISLAKCVNPDFASDAKEFAYTVYDNTTEKIKKVGKVVASSASETVKTVLNYISGIGKAIDFGG